MCSSMKPTLEFSSLELPNPSPDSELNVVSRKDESDLRETEHSSYITKLQQKPSFCYHVQSLVKILTLISVLVRTSLRNRKT